MTSTNRTEKKRIHVHLAGDPDPLPIEVLESDTVEVLAALVHQSGKLGDVKVEEILIFEEDSEEQLPRSHRILSSHPGTRFHAHRCERIEVTFVQVDTSKPHAFRPGATIRQLLGWAEANFPVDKGKKYALRLEATSDPLPHHAHIGSYVKPHSCKVTLYFTPAGRILG